MALWCFCGGSIGLFIFPIHLLVHICFLNKFLLKLVDKSNVVCHLRLRKYTVHEPQDPFSSLRGKLL